MEIWFHIWIANVAYLGFSNQMTFLPIYPGLAPAIGNALTYPATQGSLSCPGTFQNGSRWWLNPQLCYQWTGVSTKQQGPPKSLSLLCLHGQWCSQCQVEDLCVSGHAKCFLPHELFFNHVWVWPWLSMKRAWLTSFFGIISFLPQQKLLSED